jgi:hypothetical protein
VVKKCSLGYSNFVSFFHSCNFHLERPSDISSCIFVAVLSVQDEDEVRFDSILLFVPLLLLSNVHNNANAWFFKSRLLSLTAELNI